MSYTEFVKAQFIVHAFEHMATRFTYEEAERPVVFQIYRDDPGELLEAALRLPEKRPDIIDINMGCPAKSVANRGAGVGLMRNPLKVARIFRRLSAALDVPLTAIAVHGRTKEQGLQRRSGLGCHCRGQGGGEDPGHRQWGCQISCGY